MRSGPILSLLFLLFPLSILQAQTNDHLLWTTYKIQQQINRQYSWAIAPMLRFQDNWTSYQNASLDLSLKRRITKTWSLQLLSRTWFIPTQTNRQFLWLDLAYAPSIQQVKVSTRIRWHQAFNLKERLDPDYVRWKMGVEYQLPGRIHPFLYLELWLRLNQLNQFQRLRIEPGLKYRINSQLQIHFVLRREQTLNLQRLRKDNIYLLTLSYRLATNRQRQ